MSEYMIVWAVRFDGLTVVCDSFREGLEFWLDLRRNGETALFYPKLMLKGRFRRGLKEFTGW